MRQRVLQYTWVTNILICSVVVVVHNDNFTSVHCSYFQTEMLAHCYENISITALHTYFVLFEIKSNLSKIFEVSLLPLENSMIKMYLTLHVDSLCSITFICIGSDKISISRTITPVHFRFTRRLISEIILEKYVGSFVQIPDFNCCHGNKNSGSSE